ncbi:hypothetical protein BLA29_014679, partial [Euroglyphus maynei]
MYRKCLLRNGYKTNDNNWFIAKGGFGSVFRVERNDNRYACKIISNVMHKMNSQYKNNNNNVLNTTKMRSRFYNEVNIMDR